MFPSLSWDHAAVVLEEGSRAKTAPVAQARSISRARDGAGGNPGGIPGGLGFPEVWVDEHWSA